MKNLINRILARSKLFIFFLRMKEITPYVWQMKNRAYFHYHLVATDSAQIQQVAISELAKATKVYMAYRDLYEHKTKNLEVDTTIIN